MIGNSNLTIKGQLHPTWNEQVPVPTFQPSLRMPASNLGPRFDPASRRSRRPLSRTNRRRMILPKSVWRRSRRAAWARTGGRSPWRPDRRNLRRNRRRSPTDRADHPRPTTRPLHPISPRCLPVWKTEDIFLLVKLLMWQLLRSREHMDRALRFKLSFLINWPKSQRGKNRKDTNLVIFFSDNGSGTGSAKSMASSPAADSAEAEKGHFVEWAVSNNLKSPWRWFEKGFYNPFRAYKACFTQGSPAKYFLLNFTSFHRDAHYWGAWYRTLYDLLLMES